MIDFFGRAEVGLSSTLPYGTVWSLSCLTAWYLRGEKKEYKVQEDNLAIRSLFSHTQGLSGDGVDPAVVTSWVILETTRSAISCLSSSTCSPIKGIELSITCRRREKQHLVRRFSGDRCLFQLTSHINLFCVSKSLPKPVVTTPLHAETCSTFWGVGFCLGSFGNGIYFLSTPHLPSIHDLEAKPRLLLAGGFLNQLNTNLLLHTSWGDASEGWGLSNIVPLYLGGTLQQKGPQEKGNNTYQSLRRWE